MMELSALPEEVTVESLSSFSALTIPITSFSKKKNLMMAQVQRKAKYEKSILEESLYFYIVSEILQNRPYLKVFIL